VCQKKVKFCCPVKYVNIRCTHFFTINLVVTNKLWVMEKNYLHI